MLPFAIAVVAVLGLLPARYIAWVNWFKSPALTLVAPISGPLHALTTWLRPAEIPVDNDMMRTLREERDAFQQMYLQKSAEVDRLTGVIAALQQVRTEFPGLQTRILSRPVVANSSDLSSGTLAIRIGGSDGVTLSSVATIRGVQILGRIQSVDARLCYVLPITHPSAGPVGARILLSGPPGAAPISLSTVLKPVGDGTLVGDIQYEVNKATLLPYTPQIGDRVRIDDKLTWSAVAQHMLIGEVIRVEPSQNNPGRNTVTVRPSIPQLDRVSDVMLLISTEEEPAVEGARK